MILNIRKSKCQSILEYATLIFVISAGLLAMQKYVRRALNARLIQVQEELNENTR